MRVSNNSKSICSFSAVNTKYLKEAKKDYKLLWYVSPSILDSIEAIRPFAKNLEDRIARLLPKFDARIDF